MMYFGRLLMICYCKRMIKSGRIVCLLLMLVFSFRAGAEDFTNAIRAFLQERVEVGKQDVAMVIGIVDTNGSRVVGCGQLDNGTVQEVNGDTVFEIGSITKTFTGLLLQDMVERGEMKLDDPVAKYLPKSVRMPAYEGKQITLYHLATHTSGLPLLPYNLNPKWSDNPYADYTIKKLYDFLSGFELNHPPGKGYEYSEMGMELLGQAIALRAGTNYESLVVNRICRPLKMDSTLVTLTPELKSRLAFGHDRLGHKVPSLGFQGLEAGCGLRSTANDLLKYLSANLGLTPSSLTPLMDETHKVHYESMRPYAKVGLAWMIGDFPQGTEFIMHGGVSPGYTSFIGFDPNRRRGVVVLTSSDDLIDVNYLGMLLLESQWQRDLRPKTSKISGLDYDSYVGEYTLSPNIGLGIFALRMFLANMTRRAWAVVAGFCLCVLLLVVLLERIAVYRRLRKGLFLRWQGISFRIRCVLLGIVALAVVALAVQIVLAAAQKLWAPAHPVIGIHRNGDRLFIQCTGSSHFTNDCTLPQITGELLPESKARFFERLSCIPITFSRAASGKVTGLTTFFLGSELSFVKTSDTAPDPPDPLELPATVKLDPKLCDAFVGQYQFPPGGYFPNGLHLAIWRNGSRLLGRASDTTGHWGTFDVYPESATNLFFTLTIFSTQLDLTKNNDGKVTSVICHVLGMPDLVGEKLNPSH